MSKEYDLSILIPALNEEFLARTVQDILEKKRGRTEVIVGLDGKWSEPGVADHPDVTVLYSSKNLGQRGMTNKLAKLSKAKYVAKCDAHCAFDEGFDIKLMDALKGHDDWTIVPVMRNMHIFNWKCKDCGDETYQGPEPEGCKSCNANTPDRFEKKIIWNPKPSPQSSAYKFTPNRLQFKYFGSQKKTQHRSGEQVVETMSLQGSFFMLTRDKYWELNICDESWGGWGQQGTEVALKTWLSGGRVVAHLGTWYAHMFRTQSNFAFPWGNPARQQQKAREMSWKLFRENQWDKQVRPLSWVIERFWDDLQKEPDTEDDPRWTRKDLEEIKATEGRFNERPKKGIIYYTDNQLKLKIAKRVQKDLMKLAKELDIPVVSASLKPMDNMGKNVVVKGKRGYLTMFKQILAALEASDAEYIYFCEHDNLYHKSHLDFVPPDKENFYYDINWWKIHPDDLAVHWDAEQVSGLVCSRDLAIKWYRNRVATFNEKSFDRKFEPTVDGRTITFKAEYPSIDLRHNHNLTYNKKKLDHFRNKATAVNFETKHVNEIEGWTGLSDILK
jgi:hypothetical protein